MSETIDRPLSRAEVAEMLTKHGYRVAEATLATKAARGGGPPYQMFGRYALYRWEDALEWARNRVTQPATGK